MKRLLIGTITTLAFAQFSWASIIFDNFNVDEGHFGFDPNFSSTSVGDDDASIADYMTTGGPFEGAGYQQLTLIHDAGTTPLRIRHLSGGPPYNSTTGGAPTGNAGFSFTTSGGTDGWIGFYLRTTATGWQTSLNLDQPGNTGALMKGSTSVPIRADGQWHLYEWDLDNTAAWGSVPGIGGASTLVDATYTIDSVYFRDMDGTPGPTAVIDFDFVAKSDTGSIAALVPEPSTFALSLLGGFGLLIASRRRHTA